MKSPADILRAECLHFLRSGHPMVLRTRHAKIGDLVCEGMPYDIDFSDDSDQDDLAGSGELIPEQPDMVITEVATGKQAVQALSLTKWQRDHGLAFFTRDGQRITTTNHNDARYLASQAFTIRKLPH